MREQGGRSGRGCLKTGFVGCAGCLVVGVLAILGIVAVGLILGVPDQELVSREFARELPMPEAEQRRALQPSELQTPGEFPVTPGEFEFEQVGRVVLDLSEGEFIVEPGPPGEPIRIEADYDSGSYELTEEFEGDEDSAWVYRVKFASSLAWVQRIFSGNEPDNRVRIILPRGIPFALEGNVSLGEFDIELGGLWVTDVDMEAGIGEHKFSFDEPLPQPLDRFRLDGSIGETQISRLGNASPKDVSVDYNIGEVTLDLRGTWVQDSDIEASLNIGELSVYLPDEDAAAVELERADVSIGDKDLRLFDRAPAPEGAPTLRLALSGTIGELSVAD